MSGILKKLKNLFSGAADGVPLDRNEPWAALALADMEASPREDAWMALIESAQTTESRSAPTQKWQREAGEIVDAIGAEDFQACLMRWCRRALAMPEAGWGQTSYQVHLGFTGVFLRACIWASIPHPAPALIDALGALAQAMYEQNRSERIGNAVSYALGMMESDDAITELCRLQWELGGRPTRQRQIDRALDAAAERKSVTRDALRAQYGGAEIGAPSSARVATSFKGALETALAGNDLVALEAVLHVWREVRSPELAELIDRLSERCAKHSRATKEADQLSDPNRWLWHAGNQQAEDLHALLPWFGKRSYEIAYKQVERLALWPPDPRIGILLARFVAHPRYDSARARNLWQAAFDALLTHADGRCLRVLQEVAPNYAENFQDSMQFRERLADWLEAKLQLAIESIRGQARPVLDGESAALLGKLVDRVAPSARVKQNTRLSSDLLAEIYADPGNDELRLVYGDHLQTVGDPRGEFITLQLLDKPDRRQRARANALLKEHRREWLGKLGNVLILRDLKFRRGFPVEGVASPKTRGAARQTIGLSEWATIEKLWVSDEVPVELIADRAMRSLRDVGPIGFDAAMTLWTDEETRRPIEVLRVVQPWGRDSALHKLAECPGLPALRDLSLDLFDLRRNDLSTLAWFLDAEHVRRLQRLELKFERPRVGARMAEWIRRDTVPPTAVVTAAEGAGWSLIYTRATQRLDAKFTGPNDAFLSSFPGWRAGYQPIEILTGYLDALPRGVLKDFELHVPRAVKLGRSAESALRDAVSRTIG